MVMQPNNPALRHYFYIEFGLHYFIRSNMLGSRVPSPSLPVSSSRGCGGASDYSQLALQADRPACNFHQLSI